MSKKCKGCGDQFEPRYNTMEAFCSKKCTYAHKNKKSPLKRIKKPIPKRSKKRIVQDLQYSVLRKEFLGRPENRFCPITRKPSTEIHHVFCGKDRDKYYLDISTWMAVSREGHNFIHSNPILSREKGWLK